MPLPPAPEMDLDGKAESAGVGGGAKGGVVLRVVGGNPPRRLCIVPNENAIAERPGAQVSNYAERTGC